MLPHPLSAAAQLALARSCVPLILSLAVLSHPSSWKPPMMHGDPSPSHPGSLAPSAELWQCGCGPLSLLQGWAAESYFDWSWEPGGWWLQKPCGPRAAVATFIASSRFLGAGMNFHSLRDSDGLWWWAGEAEGLEFILQLVSTSEDFEQGLQQWGQRTWPCQRW